LYSVEHHMIDLLVGGFGPLGGGHSPGIDHIVLDSGMTAGQVRTVRIDGSDHKALLAIVRFD